jgi:LPS-assembly lipoprotein
MYKMKAETCVRLLSIGATALLLSSCGFQPLMGKQEMGPAASRLAQIRVNSIEDRSGQILRNHLVDALSPRGNPVAPIYTLDIKLTEPRQEIAIRRDESASRVSYTANAGFILRDLQGKALFSGGSSSSSTYEATTSEFASIAGQQSARDRAMQEISADIRQQLAAYFFRVGRNFEPPVVP